MHLLPRCFALGPFATGLSFAALAASSARAGGTPENAILVVDPSNPESLYVANYYRAARDLPSVNIVYMSPTPATYAQFVGSTLDGFLGSLENLRLVDHADYVVLPSGGSFYVDAPGLVADPCYPVSRFSAIAPFVLAHERSQILAGVDSTLPNGYCRATDEARAFDASLGWTSGSPSSTGYHYFIGAMLGYTGTLGNTLPEVLAMIDRSVAVDGTLPAGTFYFMHTNDPARSGPRDGGFPGAVAAITSFGGSAQLLFADLPIGNFDCMGIMTGLADPNIAIWTLMGILTWKYIGFAVILMLAGLQSIPDELSEAARIDGASYWQVQRHIMVPLLGPTIRIWAFLSIIGALQLFDLVYIIWGQYIASTAGTSTMATYMVANGRNAGNYGYGNAVAVIMFLISLIVALLYQRIVLRRDMRGAVTQGVN